MARRVLIACAALLMAASLLPAGTVTSVHATVGTDATADGPMQLALGDEFEQPPIEPACGDPPLPACPPSEAISGGTGGYIPVPAERVLEAQTIGRTQSFVVHVGGASALPAVGVGAVVLSVTAAQSTGWSFLTAWPTGARRPGWTTTDLAAGVHTVWATYLGDENFVTIFTWAQFIDGVLQEPVPTETWLDPPPASALGAAADFSARVFDPNSADGAPTGTVAFLDGDVALCTAQLTEPEGGGEHQADCWLTFGELGDHSITAVYYGDELYAPSASEPWTHVVKYGADIALKTVADPADPTLITFTASVTGVSPATAIPTGSVVFAVDAPELGGTEVPLDETGVATWTSADLAETDHVVWATYSGDHNYVVVFTNVEITW